MRFFITLLFAFAYLFAYAQPANDDCTGVIDLGVAPYCPDAVFFSNVGATASDIGFGNSPSCFNGGLAENDVWFSFIASDTILDYTITVTGLSDGTDPPLTNPQIALYRGECMVDGLAELLCVSAEEGATEVELDANGLTPNVPYFIRISDYSATATPNEGSFQICVEELEPINTIDQMSSTACTGELYDSGGPDGDYQNNEDFTFTICPQELTNCINFSLQYYNLGLDNLTFYDGDDTNAPIIGSVGGASVAGSGGVCYEVQASSGCLTVQFQSDATATFEGFAGSWACSAQACEEAVPLAVASGVTEEEIIDFITTPQTVVTITDITCSENSYGTFTATDQTGLGLERGLLLTTGTLDWAIGPNDDDGFGNVAGGLGLPGDDDLDVLSEQGGVPLPSQDACVISLDVFAATNELTFEYIFASEEYPEFVGGGFNDIFAFLISGPGIAGNPAIDNQLNIAALPDGTPVQIDDINSDTNWEYYRDNSGGQSIQYDGLTSDFLGIKKSLTARAQVQPCSTYQLKLAIADRGDDLFDSGVFISELKGGSPSVSIKFNSGIDYLIEDCTTLPDEIVIALNNTLEDTVTYNINLGGTAELGIDYDLELPSSITFLPGEQEFIFPITVLSDLLDESTELITIALSNDFGCGEVTLTTLEIPLEDVLDIQIAAGQDTVYLCTDEVAELSVEGAANYFWSPVSIFDDPFITNPVASPDSSQLVFVEGSVGQCTAVDSVYLQQIDPVLAINPLSPPAICEGDSVTLQVTNNANNQGFAWEENELISDPTAPTITIAPTSTEVFTANLDLSGCVTSDSLEIVVDSFTFPMVAADTVICQNYSVQLATQEPGLVTTTYEWSPANGLSDPTDPEAIATPEVTTTYTLIAMSASELCADTADIQLTVTPVDVAIQNPDTTLLCKGESVDLQAITNTGLSTGLVWNADPTLSDSIGLVVTATPEISTSYLATFALGDCVVFDSVLVQVDSLPATLPIMPLDTSVCEGSLVLLTSPIYDPAIYPNLTFEWTPALGQETPDSLLNMIISAQDTITYKRLSISGACIDSSFATVNAKPIPQVTLDPLMDSLCVGGSIQLSATSNVGFDSLSWNPESALSCTDCLDPVFTPTASGEIAASVTAILNECSGSASSTFTVLAPPLIDVPASSTICPGQSVQLNLLDDGISSYTWTSTEPGFSSTVPLLEVTPTTTTTYFLNATNECGTRTDTIQLEVFEDFELIVSDDLEVCTNTPFSLNAVSVLPPGFQDSYLWEWNGQSATTPTITGETLSETSVFRLTYEYNCGVVVDSVIVTVQEPPTVNFPTENTICFNGPGVTLNTTPDPTYTYQWSAIENPDFSSTDAAPVVSPTDTTTYLVTITNTICPPVEASFTLNVIEQVEVMIEPVDIVCPNTPVELLATSTAGDGVAESFVWELDGTIIGEGQSIIIDSTLITEDFMVDLLYTYGNDCETVVETVEILVDNSLVITGFEVTPNDTIGLGATVTIGVLTEPEDAPDLTYTWLAQEEGSDVITIISEDRLLPVQEPQATTTYTIVIGTPTLNCEVMDTVTIIVTEPEYRIPNVFTPNADGTNDFFNVVSNGTIEIEDFKVYNRWGAIVYDNDNPTTGWDGTVDGNDPLVGVYIYRISIRIGNQTFMESGDVTLLR